VSPGAEGARALSGILDGATRRSREWQAEQILQTGFATEQAAIGHEVIGVLRRRGYPLTVAIVAGHLAAVGTGYNWQGNARIGEVVGRSERTVQRARARLEEDGLIASYLLLTGDKVDGQRAPVRHPQVVRDVSQLQRLARQRLMRANPSAQRPPRTSKRRRPSAAERTPPQEPMTAADWAKLGEAHPEFSAWTRDMAAAGEKTTRPERPPPNAANVTPEEIEEWERVTPELERKHEQRERAPPPRGPPRR
jgi:DNA-binding Lrp family transcriptional regulator